MCRSTGGSNLPKGWKPDPSHKNPNGERWVSPEGDEGLDFHKGRQGPGIPGFEGKDHWHKLKPNPAGDGWETDKSGGRKRGHYLPGDEVEIDAVDFCTPESPFNLSQPTNEEIRLQIDGANNMEKFWTKVLIGSAVAAGGYFAPGLIPVLSPAIPTLAPKFAY